MDAGGPTPPRTSDWPDGVEPLIFISYRKALSETSARLLFTHLNHRFEGKVFLDSPSLRGGRPWESQLERALRHPALCVVVFIVAEGIWSHCLPGRSTPRLWDEDDVVLRELEIALDRWEADDADAPLEVILAPETKLCRVPTVDEIFKPDIPARTQRVLKEMARIEMKDERELDSMLGTDALVQDIKDTVEELGARRHFDVRTWADLERKAPRDARVLRNGLQKRFDDGDRDARVVANLAALMVRDGEYPEARELLRHESNKPAASGVEPDDERYWRAFAALALAKAELRGEPPRKLPSLRLARELAKDVLLPALEALDSEHDAVELHTELARALDDILTGYFDSRGIKITADPWAEAQLDEDKRLVPRMSRQLRRLIDDLQAGPAIDGTGHSISERNVWR